MRDASLRLFWPSLYLTMSGSQCLYSHTNQIFHRVDAEQSLSACPGELDDHWRQTGAFLSSRHKSGQEARLGHDADSTRGAVAGGGPCKPQASSCSHQHSALIELCKYSYINVTMRHLLKQNTYICVCVALSPLYLRCQGKAVLSTLQSWECQQSREESQLPQA